MPAGDTGSHIADTSEIDRGIAALAARIVEVATRLNARIAVAESLTGGLLAAAIVSVPGASRVFSGGIVSYDTFLKHSLLQVDEALLKRRGPVDPEVAAQMARGVRYACAVPTHPEHAPVAADFGVATTGVAGPDPDPQTGQPAGTVWIAVSATGGEQARSVRLDGDRARVRALTVRAGLDALLTRLLVALPAASPTALSSVPPENPPESERE